MADPLDIIARITRKLATDYLRQHGYLSRLRTAGVAVVGGDQQQ